MENNKQLLSAMKSYIWAVFSTKRSRVQYFFFVKYCIQWPFVDKETALIEMWRAFFKTRFVAFGEKKVPYTHQDVTFLRRRFAAFDAKKVLKEPLPYTG